MGLFRKCPLKGAERKRNWQKQNGPCHPGLLWAIRNLSNMKYFQAIFLSPSLKSLPALVVERLFTSISFFLQCSKQLHVIILEPVFSKQQLLNTFYDFIGQLITVVDSP